MRTTVTRGTRLLAVASLCLLAASAGAQVSQSWTFDSGLDGWNAISLTGLTDTGVATTSYQTGGYMVGVAATGSLFFEKSGLGDFSAYNGGTIAFDLMGSTPDVSTFDNVVLLVGTDGSRFASKTYAAPASDIDWTSYVMNLVGTEFDQVSGTASFDAVLSSLSSIRIGGEFYDGPAVGTGLDTVRVTAIPEPSTTAAMLGGAALLVVGLARYRRKR